MAAISSPRAHTQHQNTHLCTTCNTPTDQKCGRCKTAFYCSRACQKKNWLQHKQVCKLPEEEKITKIAQTALDPSKLPAIETLDDSWSTSDNTKPVVTAPVPHEEKPLPHNEDEFLTKQWEEIANQHKSSTAPYSYANEFEIQEAANQLDQALIFPKLPKNFPMPPELLQEIFDPKNLGDCLFLGEGNGIQALPAILEGAKSPSIKRNYTIVDTPDMIAGTKDKFNQLLSLLTNSQLNLKHLPIDMHEIEIGSNQYALINLLNCIQYMDPQKAKELLCKVWNGLTDKGVLFLSVCYLRPNEIKSKESLPSVLFSSYENALEYLRTLGFTPVPNIATKEMLHPALSGAEAFLCLKKTRD